MKKHVARKWIAALRSGKYRQGKNKLQAGNAYCCLGVLCKIAPKYVQKRIIFTKKNQLIGGTLYTQNPVKEWAGLKDHSGSLPIDAKTGFIDLVAYNDAGKSFKEIALIIEKYAEEL